MARIYHSTGTPEQSSPFESDLVTNFIKLELLAGAFCLAAGGFVLRIRDNYSLIVLGGTLLVLGFFRFWQSSSRRTEARKIEGDRVLRTLRHKLGANYSIVVDYPLTDEDSIPYLVMGPPGIFVLNPWSKQREVREAESPDEWVLVRNPDSTEEFRETVPNPIEINKHRVRLLTETVDRPGLLSPVDHYVVLTGRRADCPVLQHENVLEINELSGRLLAEDRDEVLSWEDVEDLEHLLELKG